MIIVKLILLFLFSLFLLFGVCALKLSSNVSHIEEEEKK